MLKKTVKYVDYEGKAREEDFYFNLNKAELMRMNLSTPGGITKQLRHISQKMDVPAIMETFRTFILDSYGVISSDGKRFIKTPQLKEEFEQTEAYSEIFMELCTNAEAAADFIAGVVPKEVGDEFRKQYSCLRLNHANHAHSLV